MEGEPRSSLVRTRTPRAIEWPICASGVTFAAFVPLHHDHHVIHDAIDGLCGVGCGATLTGFRCAGAILVNEKSQITYPQSILFFAP